MENVIKNEIVSQTLRNPNLAQELSKIVYATNFIEISVNAMIEKAGESECIFLLGDKCYYTKSYLCLQPVYKAIYFFVELGYQNYYIEGRSKSYATWLLQKGEIYDTEYITTLVTMYLEDLYLFFDLYYLYGKKVTYTSYFKKALQNVAKSLGEEPKKYVEFLDQNVALLGTYSLFDFNYVLTHFDLINQNMKEVFLEPNPQLKNYCDLMRTYPMRLDTYTLPKLTREKATTYLHQLLVCQDTSLGEVTYILEMDGLIYFNVRRTVWYVNRTADKILYFPVQSVDLLYSIEMGMLYGSTNPTYRKFMVQAKPLLELS